VSCYDPSKHEWGTDASAKRAKELTPKEGKKKVQRFKEFDRSNVSGQEGYSEQTFTWRCQEVQGLR